MLNGQTLLMINAFTVHTNYNIKLSIAGLIVMGNLVAVIAVLSGVVMTILLIVIYVLWKRWL